MGKQITLSQEELQEIANTAGRNALNEMDKRFILISGCDTMCVVGYETEIRNGDKKITAVRNVMNHIGLSFAMGFEILRDYGFIEFHPIYKKDKNNRYIKDDDGNRVPTEIPNTNFTRLTSDGFRELNGLLPQSKPFITEIGGNLYVDDTDERYNNFISKIKEHPIYDEKRIFNKTLKDRKLSYNRHELKLAEELEVEILTTKELPNGKTEND